MAEGGDDSRDPIRCGNCLEEEGYLLNPKVIPCSHIFCEECIRGHLKKTDVFTCKICKLESRFELEGLSSALTHPTFCDVCEKKGKKNMTAKAFCTICKRKYCGLHEKDHREICDDHEVLNIDKYLKSEFAEEQKFCERHNKQPVMVGCPECWKVFCAECMSTVGFCTDGSAHKHLILSKLSAELKRRIDPKRRIIEAKLTEWTAGMDKIAKSVENWDKQTSEGVRLIEETQSTQVMDLEAKYDSMKNEYIAYRSENKDKIVSYMDGDAGVRLSEFDTEMKSLRAMMANKHPVDLVAARGEVNKKMDQLVKTDFPTLILENQRCLDRKGEYREIEMGLTPKENVIIGVKRPPIVRKRPKDIKLVKQVEVGAHCNTVCHYKGIVYVGLDNGAIDKIDEQGEVTSSFIKLAKPIITVRAHNDNLYILMNAKVYKVYVYSLAGTQVRSWEHGDKYGSYGNMLTFMGGNILIADVTNNRISVYTTAGDTVRHIPCPAIATNASTAMCAAEDDYVIVSQFSPPHVHKFNLTSGAIEWTSDKITEPSCVEYSCPVVLISGDYNNSISVWILDYKKGVLLKEITDKRTISAHAFDLFVYGDNLLIPRSHEKSVLFYRLKY